MKTYRPYLSASVNRKGVLDIDTVKGCSLGMKKYPEGGCYGLCYAAKTAKFYGYDFSKSVSRKFSSGNGRQLPLFDSKVIYGKKEIKNLVKNHNLKWFRIGTMGDPCHDWELTLLLCEWLGKYKTPVVITKHWIKIPERMIERFLASNAVFNTSISPLDNSEERDTRLKQFNRIKEVGIRSVLRVVSCKFGDTKRGKKLKKIQLELFNNYPIIDNPLRIPATDKRIERGDILTEKVKDMNTYSFISLNNKATYLGKCQDCPDQCGVL
jgi:hypothetical protein